MKSYICICYTLAQRRTAMIKILLSTELGRRRWSQARLAQETGIRPSTISDYYNEMVDHINLRHFEAFCRVLECDLTDILMMEPGVNLDGKDGPRPHSKPCRKQ